MLNLGTLFASSRNYSDLQAEATDLSSSSARSASISHDDWPLRQERMPSWRARSASSGDMVLELAEGCMCCLIVALFFFFIVSLIAFLGHYRSTTLDLGPNDSRILDVDLIYMKELKIQTSNVSVTPILYGFSQLPELDQERDLFYDLNYSLKSSDYQNWKIWLNNGSKVELKYDIISSTRLFYVLIVVLRGRQKLIDWTSNPTNSKLASSWHCVHGTGVISFEADEDGEYYFTFGNLNVQNVEVRLQARIQAKFYNTKNAEFSCSLSQKFCGLILFFPAFNYALLSTPDTNLDGAEKWQVQTVYGQRWIIYLIFIGFVSSMTYLSLQMKEKIFINFIAGHEEHAQPVASTGNLREPLIATSQDSSTLVQPDDPEMGEQISELDAKKIYETQFCAICNREARCTFFHPCGHCVTCYNCGVRIQKGDSEENSLQGKCPICKLRIKEVKRIFKV